MNAEIDTAPKTIWTIPTAEEDQPTLVYLKPDAFCHAVIPVADLDKTSDLLRAGKDVASQHIPLSAITALTGTVDGSTLEVQYTHGDSKAEPLSLNLIDTAQRDQILDALAQRLGPRWQREEKPGNRFYEALWPAVFTVIIGLVTWFMYGEAQEIAAGRQLAARGGGKARLVSMVMHYVEGLIGTTGVLLLGGALTLLVLWWTCYSFVFTPRYFTLRPE